MTNRNSEQDGPPDYNYAMHQHGEQDGGPGGRPAGGQGQTLQPSSAGNIEGQGRASMEDEMRELPDGWIREWDPKQKHHFYVDTKANPPRSIWVHPYDDPEYISSIPDKHPAKQWANAQQQNARPVGQGTSGTGPARAGAAAGAAQTGQKPGLLTKMHDKLTGTTKEERDAAKEQQRQHRSSSRVIPPGTEEAGCMRLPWAHTVAAGWATAAVTAGAWAWAAWAWACRCLVGSQVGSCWVI
ncbi:hypothetical protein CALCODRAFT_303190 [Calocera cornea HHB12733]|uniref:WW domain-containing protein n=1 Tax=Calocera cornea HHB12733 TaxID=1353952 RepID=A0A165JJR9_9BASI|nr:hypothetical protein CALCODRAFT_303190 [Calocera cornea HHB12733]